MVTRHRMFRLAATFVAMCAVLLTASHIAPATGGLSRGAAVHGYDRAPAATTVTTDVVISVAGTIPSGSGTPRVLAGDAVLSSAAEDAENPIERIYEPNPKHGPEPYIDSQG